jgi:uncharacterized protein HemX
MRRLVAFFLVVALCLACSVSAGAQRHTGHHAQNENARKMEKKQQRAMKKYAKAQRRAQRKMRKINRKNTRYLRHH